MTFLYPRTLNDKLVSEDNMVGYVEHLWTKHNIVCFTGFVPESTETCNQLISLDSMGSDKPIKLIIQSPGGVLDTAFMLYDTIRTLNTPVETLGRICCSAAVILLAAGRRRYLLPHSKTMLHLPSGQFGGDVRDIDIARAEMHRYKDALVDIMLECGAKKLRAEILADMDREYWMSAEETIAYGLADEIMGKEQLKEWLK